MQVRKWVLTATLVLAASSAAAKLPAAVQQEINGDVETCREFGGRLSYSRAVQAADLNRDGYLDYVYDASKAVCAGGMDLGGSGGWLVTVFAGQADGSAKEAFAQGAVGAKIINGRLFLGVSGSLCGQNTNNLPNARYEHCIRPLQWNVRKKEFEFAPVSQKRPFPASWAR